jgi:hypothetical protein
MSTDGYTEHKAVEIGAFVVVDATATGSRGHDDLVWIACRGEGEWVSPEQAMEFAKAIESVVLSHNTRRGK